MAKKQLEYTVKFTYELTEDELKQAESWNSKDKNEKKNIIKTDLQEMLKPYDIKVDKISGFGVKEIK